MAKDKSDKTNAARLLDKAGIRYELRSYDIGDEHLSAEQVARAVGMDPTTVFKTLLARGDREGLCFAVIPAHLELDLKALARASNDKKLALVPLKEVQPLTGYVRGGVTALAAKRDLPVYLHASAQTLPQISVSAGRKGLQIVLSPLDYRLAARATWFG